MRPTTLLMDRPVKAVALDPAFHSSTSRIISGGDKVKLHEKSGFLSRMKESILYQGEAPIRHLFWKGNYVVFATDKSVRVYDMTKRCVISLIREEPNSLIQYEMFRCCIAWKDASTLLIGRVDCVRVLKIHPQDAPLLVQGQHPILTEISAMFTTEFYLCGIAPLGNQVVVLSVPKDNEVSQELGSRPQLTVLEPSPNQHYHEVCRATLCIKNHQAYPTMYFHLESLPEDGLFFVVSPKDVILAKPWEEEDHVNWLLKRGRYKEAVHAVLSNKRNFKDRKVTLKHVGDTALDNLVKQKRFKEAAELCPDLIGGNEELWEREVYRFAQAGQARALAPYLSPKVLPIRLSPALYEMVLNEYIQIDPQGLLERIQEWPPERGLYDVGNVVEALVAKLSTIPHCEIRLQCLAELSLYQKKYQKALNIFLLLKLKDKTFDLIRKHKDELLNTLDEKLELLLELDHDEATRILLDHTDRLPVARVIERLQDKTELLYKYLDRIVSKDPSLAEGHHGLLVELYAKYNPSRLHSFLQTSNSYPLEEAMRLCEFYGLTKEAIFLLGRMGNTKKALQQTLEQLGDVEAAMTLCREHGDDKELWWELVEASMRRPDFITALLQGGVASHIDPALLVQRIPDQMPIPGLRDALVALLHDFTTQISLREGCKRILVTDCFNLLDRLYRQQRRGISVDETRVCQVCNLRILVPDIRFADEMHIFFCHHIFHRSCLLHGAKEMVPPSCPICKAQVSHPNQKG